MMLSPAPDRLGLAAPGYDAALTQLVLPTRRPGVVPRRPPDGAAMAPAARPATAATAARWRHDGLTAQLAKRGRVAGGQPLELPNSEFEKLSTGNVLMMMMMTMRLSMKMDWALPT